MLHTQLHEVVRKFHGQGGDDNGKLCQREEKKVGNYVDRQRREEHLAKGNEELPITTRIFLW